MVLMPKKKPGREFRAAAASLVLFCLVFFVPAKGYEANYLVMTEKRVELYYQPRDGKVAAQYLSWATAYRPRPEFLSGSRPDSLRIYIAPTEGEFYRLTGGRLPEWGVACALPGLNIIVLRSPRLVPLWKEKPRNILLHEISHIFLEQQLRPAEIPRWFHEGFALYCSQAWDLGNFLELSLSLVLGRFFPLDSLATGFPAEEGASRLAYLQSYTVVEYLFTSRDTRQLSMLFDRWRELGDLDKALRSSFGITLLKFEDRWKEWALVRYGWMKLLTSITLIWIVAAVLFIFVFISRRAKFHRKLAEMKEREVLISKEEMDYREAHTGPDDSQAEDHGRNVQLPEDERGDRPGSPSDKS